MPRLDGAHLDLLRERFVVLASGEGANEDIGESWHAAARRSARQGDPQPGRLLGSRTGPHDWPLWRAMLPGYLDESGGVMVRTTSSSLGERRSGGSAATRQASEASHSEMGSRRDRTTDRQTAIRWMLRDLQALQLMLADGRFETDIARIGAEQEMFLVDGSWQPAPGALPMLAATDRPAVHDRGRGVQPRAQPRPAGVQRRLPSPGCRPSSTSCSTLGRAAAEAAGLHVVLAGTLPTIRKRDLSMDNMVQNPRYLALNDALMGLRGEAYELHIKGTDELRVRQDSVMAEACNASFQVHLQVTPDEFANAYNVAQALSRARRSRSATNSPLLFGKRLWAETRIALFEQSVDTRRPGHHMRDAAARVSFGDGWVTRVGRRAVQGGHHPLPPACSPPTTTSTRSPSWPRARPEPRRRCACTPARCGAGTVAATASRPTRRRARTCASRTACCRRGRAVVDEVANAALWLGLMRAVAEAPSRDQPHRCRSSRRASNFVAAARQGLVVDAGVARRRRARRPAR